MSVNFPLLVEDVRTLPFGMSDKACRSKHPPRGIVCLSGLAFPSHLTQRSPSYRLLRRDLFAHASEKFSQKWRLWPPAALWPYSVPCERHTASTQQALE